MRRPLIILGVVVLVAVLVVGILQSGGSDDDGTTGAAPTSAETRKALAGSPAPLAALHDQANGMLDVGGLQDRLEALHGYPVVVNVWGAWCNPCREEFPILEELSVRYGRRVAFLGVATQASEESTSAFLAKHPVPYPSYMDFDGKVADAYGVIGAPATIFFDRAGERAYFHQGKYDTVDDLAKDIERYALG